MQVKLETILRNNIYKYIYIYIYMKNENVISKVDG